MNAKPRVIPFRIGGPIQASADFAGRKDILQAVSDAMLNLQNVSLHGERRTGKTSLLLYLAHPTMSSIVGLPETHIPVYFNFQDFSEARAANVWQAMADAIAEQIKQRHPDGQAESERFLATIAEFLNTPEAPELFGTGFGRAFAHLDDSDFKFHLLFDEFDQTTRNPNLGDPFYDALRSLPTRAENISYVIATRTGLTALQPIYNKVSSPLFNIFTQVILGPFQEDEVYRLIFDYFARAELDISLAEKLCAESPFLHELTGYHPFFLQTLCYHLCARLDEPDWPLGQARQEALQAFENDSKPHFEYYWEVSSKEEQGLIKKLAAKRPIDWDQLETKALVANLKDRCLVIRVDERKGEWRLFSSAFSEWIAVEVNRQQRIEALYEEGLEYLRHQDYGKALARFEQVLDSDPDHQNAITAKKEAERLKLAKQDTEERKKDSVELSWWRSLGAATQAAIIVALIGLVGTICSVAIGPFSKTFASLVVNWSPSSPTSEILTRQIGATEILVDNVEVDTTLPQSISTGDQVEIMVQVKDVDGAFIPNDELTCQWKFIPTTQQTDLPPNGECTIDYKFPGGLSSQLVNVTVTGKSEAKIAGISIRSINFTLPLN